VTVHGSLASLHWDALSLIVLFVVGAIAAGINSVAGGGSLVSFPMLTGISLAGFRIGYGLPMKEANATNSVGLWPGSLTGAFGFANVLSKTKHYLYTLWAPTLLGSIAGSLLLIATGEAVFARVVPALLLLATLLLAFQPHIRRWADHHKKSISTPAAIALQFIVAVYGGYFGAGMGIMMLAVFTVYMEGNIHEINAVKTLLGVIINFTASIVFLIKGLVLFVPAMALVAGALVGGYYAARWSQKQHPETLRLWIAAYGLLTAGYFAYRSWL